MGKQEADTPVVPAPETKEDLTQKLAEIEAAKDKEFIEAYNELCGAHSRLLDATMTLAPGQAPALQWSVKRA